MYDSLNVPMAYVPVALLDAKDSLVYKGVITNDSGVYYFDKITPGKYLIKIIVPGYAIKYSSSFELDNASNLQIPDLKISSAGINLNEIAVTVIKRPIEFKNGNVTVFIEGSPLAVGNTAFDLLSRLPGVTVVDDNISIQGKQGVKIFIDDRMQQLSGQQIINVLKGINASMIEKIEIMKNPPVKYDASGSAGIINIKTKKIKIIGFSGSINATYTQAYYGNGLSGLELNYKGKKLTFFSSIGAADESVRKVNHTDRVVLFNSNTSELDQVYFERERNPYLYANIGSDWFVNSKNIIGVKISSWGAVAHHDRVGNIDIKNSDLGYNHSDYGYNKTNPWSYTNLNLNAEHLFDTVGTKLLFSADYTYNFDIYKGDFYTRFQDFTGPIISQDRIYQTANKLLLNIASAKLDFEKQLSKTLKLESGLKATHQNMLSDFYFANKDLTMDKYVTDSSLTNIFSYNELITAAYINLQKTVKKFNFQAGTRAENTNINAHSKTNDVKYTRQYFNLFPVVSVDYNANEKNSLQLSFNRRIERPDYNSFNPYRTFKNYLVTEMGNPYLMPMYMNAFNFTHTYKGKISNSITYNKIKNVYFDYTIQNDSTKETIGTITNLNGRDVLAYDIFIQQNVFKWWITTFNASCIYFKFSGEIYDQKFNVESYSYYAGINNQFIFPKKTKLELSAFYSGPWRNNVGIFESRYNVDMAIRKSFLSDKLNLVIGCSDIFFTSIFRGNVDYLNLHSRSVHTSDTRRLRFTLSYNFGKLKVQQRQVKSNDDESRRMNH